MLSAPGSGHVVAGRYRLLDQLGRGAMGVVWSGRDELLDRSVAVKQIVLAPMASATEATISYQRTLREARIAARLSHPGVVTVFDVVEEDGMPWIVMELVRARPLDQVIAEDGPLLPVQAAQLGLDLLDALAAAHAAGVLHRDVKPSNVLISPEGKAVLTDFGIATIQGDPGMTQAGMVVGTPGFSAPERVRGAVATPASDLWSLGATLYAAVEGRGPFDRAGDSIAIVASIATETAPRAPSAGALAPVIEALLRADPAERPDAATATLMLRAAWAGARAPDRSGGAGAGALASSAADHQPAAELASDLAVMEATTATQVVGVLGAEAAESRPASAAALAATAGTGTGSGDDAVASPGSAVAASVVPDLMATPAFADLKMPTLTGSADNPLSADNLGPTGPLGQSGGPPGSDRPRDTHQSGSWRSRRGLLLLAPIAVSAIVAGAVFLAFPGFGDSLVRGLSRLSGTGSGSNSASGMGHLSRHGGGTRHGSGGAAGKQGSSGGPGPSGTHRASATPTPSGTRRGSGKPSPSTNPTPSRQPSPSTSPSPSHSPSTTPSPAPTPTLPPGYLWQSESAASLGTTAGFRVATPAGWLMTPGLNTYFKPLLGSGRLGVDTAPFAAQWPVKEARHLQAAAIARYRYPHYSLVSILAMRFHGSAAATWIFSWKPVGSLNRVDVTEVIFTAMTSAGPQPYILSMSAPAPRAGWASHIMRVAMRTFTPLP